MKQNSLLLEYTRAGLAAASIVACIAAPVLGAFEAQGVPSLSPPTISDVTDKVVQKNGTTGAIPFTIGDPDDPSGNSLSMSGSSSDTTLVPNANIVFGGSGNSRTVTITPAPNLIGTTVITLTVTDADLNTASDTFNLKVNAPPHFDTNTGLTVNQGATGAFSTGILNTTDADNTPAQIIYTIASPPGGGPPGSGLLKRSGATLVAGGTFTQADVNNGLLTYTHDDSNNFSDSFQVGIADTDGGVASDAGFTSFTVNITITPVNHPPVAVNGSGSTGVGAVFNGIFQATDPDTTPAVQTLTRRITVNGTLGTAVLDDATTGAFHYTPNPGATGQDTITFQVNDGIVDSTNPGTFTIDIQNQAPTAQGANLATNENTSVNSTLVATDPDQPPQQLTYSVATPASKGTVNITDIHTGAFTYTPNVEAIGADSFTFTASDGLATSAPATVTVFIHPAFDTGDLFMSNTIQGQNGQVGSIIQVDPTNGMQAVIASGGNLTNPQAIALGGNGQLVVLNHGQGNTIQLIRIDPATGNQTAIPTVPAYNSPIGLGVAPNGTIFVSDAFAATIYALDPSTGAIIKQCSAQVPAGIGFDKQGQLIVGLAAAFAGGTSRVVQFNMGTCTETVISSGNNITLPVSVAVDSTGDILLGNGPSLAGAPGTDELIRITRSNGNQAVLSTGVGRPTGLAVNPGTHDTYSANGAGVTVFKTTSAGTTTVATTADNVVQPFGLAIAPFVPTAARVSVSGHVMSAGGAGIRNARVELQSTLGTVYTVMTNAFGYYTFDQVPSGGSYLLTATARGRTFRSRVVIVSDSLAVEDMIADQ